MRVAFLGSADFSVPSLRACALLADVAVVVTQPERPGSRGRPAPRPVAEAASQLGLEVWQPERLRDPAATGRLQNLRPDALVVAAYGQILPTELLNGMPLGGINVHASLLPRWRGAAPVAAAILAGDEVTGVSLMRMDAGIDTGPVFATRSLRVSGEATTPSLTAALAELGAELLSETLPAIERGVAQAVPQPEEGATYAPRLSRADAALQWGRADAIEVDRRVRALNPWPGVVVRLAGHDVHLLAGAPADPVPPAPADAGASTARPGAPSAGGEPLPAGAGPTPQPGQVIQVRGESVFVATRAGGYRVDVLRPAGGRTMTGGAFLRGRPSSDIPPAPAA
ncbi:MAG: methionyl-tRNA formyltransferase [Candidatus Dormibacteria bacterium]